VPLSEHEQRMLEQMERALYAEDPKFATALEGSELRRYTRRRVYQAVAGFLVGIALLMAGMVAQQIWISVVGFLVMLGCAVLAVTGWRKAPKNGEQQQGQSGAAQSGNGGSSAPTRRQPRARRSMMNRIEERWQRRRDEGR
jgi:predicted metalloprotease